jgi:predicted nucleic acid-binding protein
MRASPCVAVLDTCVLAPMPIVDTLLRLAEEPAFYTPKWSPQILEELRRTLAKLAFNSRQIERRIRTMTEAFPDSMVHGFEDLIPAMTNDLKDRHVLAAAVKCAAHTIVSDNRRHFPSASLSPYKLECLTADDFLVRQYLLDPAGFIGVLTEQAADIQWTLPQLISKHVPSSSRLIRIT